MVYAIDYYEATLMAYHRQCFYHQIILISIRRNGEVMYAAKATAVPWDTPVMTEVRT